MARRSAQRSVARAGWVAVFVVFLILLGVLIAGLRQEQGEKILSESEIRESEKAAHKEAPQIPAGVSGLSNVSVSGVMEAESDVTPQMLAENPEKYFGSSINVQGRVTEVMSTNTFVIGPLQGGDARVLIVGGAVPDMQAGQIVTVRGALLEYDKETLAREGGKVSPDTFPPGQDKVYAVATTSVIPAEDQQPR